MIGLPLIILVFLVAMLIKIQKDNSSSITTTNLSPTPTPIPTIEENLSPWAKDEQVLKLDQSIKQIEISLERVDLKEIGLIPPILDYEVKFE